MIPCVVIGDSLAVGIAQYLPKCIVEAQVGISSRVYVHKLLSARAASLAVISLGVNDGDASEATKQSLRTVRRSVDSPDVVWLLPASHPATRAAIASVAREFGDRLIDAGPYAGRDGLHPSGSGYRTLAALVR